MQAQAYSLGKRGRGAEWVSRCKVGCNEESSLYPPEDVRRGQEGYPVGMKLPAFNQKGNIR